MVRLNAALRSDFEVFCLQDDDMNARPCCVDAISVV